MSTTKTVSYTLYKLDELSETAQEKAHNNYCTNGLDYEWWDFVYDDAKEIGKILGIDIENIYFSGFSSQGDGAQFVGSYCYAKESVKNIVSYAPTDRELHRIAGNLAQVQRKNFYGLEATIKSSGHYSHEYCTRIDVDFTNPASGDSYYADGNTAETLREVLRDFMRWIYKQLEKEYDYLTSFEQFKETSESNDWLYLEDGTQE